MPAGVPRRGPPPAPGGRRAPPPAAPPPPPPHTSQPTHNTAVLELYTEWAGPTAACKSTWRKAALDRGGALPCDLAAACVERCGGMPGLEAYVAAPTSQPLFLFYKGGKLLAEVRGVNPSALLRELAAAEGSGPAAVVRESECC